MTKKGSKKRRQSSSSNASSSEPNSSEMLKRPKLLNLSETDRRELETLFNKNLSYTKPPFFPADLTRWISSFVLLLEEIEKTSISWQDEDLMKLKKDINFLKDQLSEKDIESWHNHTTQCNIAGKIIPYVKSLGVELCTQAWVKFYEIVNTFNIVPDQPFISVHLCEAPGAFIAALNHFLQQKGFSHKWDWCATTLHPYHESNSLSEMIADDRLIRSTYHKWHFGLDGSGDIKAPGHIEGLIDKVAQMETKMDAKVLLVTADGSKDCQENPGEQESLLSELHYCEMLAGCLMLAPGGCFVLKIFTMYEAATISLMALLNVLFQTVNAFKPATSKSGNSEMYVVCTGYHNNMEKKVLWRMLKAVRDSSVTYFVNNNDISQEFLEQHRGFCHEFAKWQSDTINRNMRLFSSPLAQFQDQLHQQQWSAIDQYNDRTYIGFRGKVQRLVPFIRDKSAFFIDKSHTKQSSSSTENPVKGKGGSPSPQAWFCQHKNLKGTFHLRQNINALSFEERIRLVEVREISQPKAELSCRWPISDKDVDLWVSKQETASIPSLVYNSRLCDASILDDYNLLLQHSQFLQHREEKCDEHIKNTASLLVRAVMSFIPDQHNHHNIEQQQEQTFQPQSHHRGTHRQDHHHYHHHHHRHEHHQQTNLQEQQPHEQQNYDHSRNQYQHHRHQQHHHHHHNSRSQENVNDHQQHHPHQYSQQQQHRQPYHQHHLLQAEELPTLSQLNVSPNSQKDSKSNPSQISHSNPSTGNSSPSPEKQYHKHSTPLRYNPNSNSKTSPRYSPRPENHNSSTPPRHDPESSTLNLVWIENGSKGDYFSSLFKHFSEQTQKDKIQKPNDHINLEVRDMKMEETTRDKGGHFVEKGDGGVVYLLNTTSLISGEVQPAPDNDGEVRLPSPTSLPFNSEELKTRGFCAKQISLVLERLPVGCSLVLLTSSFLTRFQAGLLYVLARQFQRIQAMSDPNLWLHQVVVCHGFHGVGSPHLLHQLSRIQKEVEEEGRGVVETVKFTHILNDRKFVQFVTTHNNHLLSGFINLVLDHHKDLWSQRKDEQLEGTHLQPSG